MYNTSRTGLTPLWKNQGLLAQENKIMPSIHDSRCLREAGIVVYPQVVLQKGGETHDGQHTKKTPPVLLLLGY